MVQKDLNRNERKMPLELFGYFFVGDTEAASSLSLWKDFGSSDIKLMVACIG